MKSRSKPRPVSRYARRALITARAGSRREIESPARARRCSGSSPPHFGVASTLGGCIAAGCRTAPAHRAVRVTVLGARGWTASTDLRSAVRVEKTSGL